MMQLSEFNISMNQKNEMNEKSINEIKKNNNKVMNNSDFEMYEEEEFKNDYNPPF